MEDSFESAHDRANREAREFVKTHGRRNGLEWDHTRDRLKVGPRSPKGESSGKQVQHPESKGKQDWLNGINLRRLPEGSAEAQKVGSIIRYGIGPKDKKVCPVTLTHEEWLIARAHDILPARGLFKDATLSKSATQRFATWFPEYDSENQDTQGVAIATFHPRLSRPETTERAPKWLDDLHRRNPDNIDDYLVRGEGLLNRASRRYKESGSSDGLKETLLQFLKTDLDGNDPQGLLNLATYDAIGILRGRPSNTEIDRCLTLVMGLIDYLRTACPHNFRKSKRGEEKVCAWCGLIIPAEADVPDAHCIVCGNEIVASVYGPPPTFCPKNPMCRAEFSRARRRAQPDVIGNVTSGGCR